MSGKNFNHRRGWIERRICELASVFSVDVAAYSVMSNHYHIVLHVDVERGLKMSDDEVLKRWTMIFSGPVLVQKYLSEAGKDMSESELGEVARQAAIYRERLIDLSWYMRVLNETVARMANAEDGCTGRFWEGRFKCQALLDETAILAAMSYVDLNPIRAAIAESIEESEYTSVKKRLEELRESEVLRQNEEGPGVGTAQPLKDKNREDELHDEEQLDTLPEAPLLPFASTLSQRSAYLSLLTTISSW